MRRLKTLVATIALLGALAPAPAAFAQSAGDEQYSDPLAPTAQKDPDPAPAADEPSPSADHSDPGRTAAGDDSAAKAQAEPPAADDAAPRQLPRTGFSVLLLIASGGPMLLAGVALARVSSRPSQLAQPRSLR